MKGVFRFTRVFGIDIDIHFTFFLLLIFFAMVMGAKGLLLILGVFFFVTVHELCHSFVAAYYGIKVKRITLLPIGGVAAMSGEPKSPFQELAISLAGPMANLLVVILFYYPLIILLGREQLMYPLLLMTGQAKFADNYNMLAYLYWINLVLAAFNMLPAFPMDGGRALRAILSYRMDFRRATAMAVRLGHIFALVFAYVGIVYGNFLLLIVAVFLYISASGEGMQVNVRETIKGYRVADILSPDFVSVDANTHLSKLLELMLHTHQENFPVMNGDALLGVVTRGGVLRGIQDKRTDPVASEFMRTELPAVDVSARLNEVRKIMQKFNTGVLPVKRGDRIAGIVTLDDISRIYMMLHERETGI